MIDLTQKLPKYITTKRNIALLVIYTSGFALLFINIYAPFGVETWYDISKLELFFFSSLIILTGVLVVAFSRIIMYQRIHRKKKEINIGQYLVWVAAEIVSMSMFYSLFELLILHDTRSFLLMYRIALTNTTLVLSLPYAVLWLYFAHDHTQRLLSKIDATDSHITPEHITFYDEKNAMRLTMKIDDLLFLKGADNYVEVIYQHQEKQAKYHLRTTMKRLQDDLIDFPVLRCHRSYMVNKQRIKLIRREGIGMVLELDSLPAITIPISKTYMENVLKQFSQTNFLKT